jgi:hypothetical protein
VPSSTPVYAIPYPTGGDDLRDGDNAIQALAARVEALLSVPTGNRNMIRNGDMSVAQRGNGPFTAQGVYGIDGWASTYVGGGNSVSRFQTIPFGVPSKWGLNAVVSSQTLVSHYAQVFTRVEGVESLAGKTVTFSFTGLANPASKVAVELSQVFGTGGSPSATVNTSVGSIQMGPSPLARYSLTFAVPSVTGKTIGSASNDYLQVTVWLSAGTDYAARTNSIGLQNATFQFTDVQLEVGDKATPFERLNPQAQLAWCHRYYYRMNNTTAGNIYVGNGVAWNINNLYTPVVLPVPLRSTAIVYTASAALGALFVGNVAVSGTSGVATMNNIVTITGTGTYTAGAAGLLYVPPGVYFDVSAEM